MEGTVASTPGPTPADPSPTSLWFPAWARHPLVESALIGALALTLHLAGNGHISLFDRDEPRYAQCTREMRESGDWVRPTFNGEPRYHKPVLIYWLMLAGTSLGGDDTFGVRLVSGVMGAGTVLLTWHLGRRMLGPTTGRLAALMMACAPIAVAEAKMATTDATLACFVVAGQVLVWRLARGPSLPAALGLWVMMALAVLTKGPVGPAMIACAGLVSWWWGGPTACWRRLRPSWGVPLFLAVVLPWFVAIGVLTQGEFFRFAVGDQLVTRAARGVEQHGAFPGYYVVTMLGCFHPWSSLVPAALLAAWKGRRERPELGFLLGWVVGPWLLLECVQTKLVHYYLPSLPGAALLVAWFIGEVVAGGVSVRRGRFGRLAMGLLGGTALVATVGLVALAWVFPASMHLPLWTLAVLVFGGTLYSIDRYRQADTMRATYGLVVTWSVVMFLMGAWCLPSAEPYRISGMVAAKLREWSGRERAKPVLANFQQPSVIYCYGRPIVVINSYEDLLDQLDDGHPVVSALRDVDLDRIALIPEIRVTVLETIRGFNVDKGQKETLHMARLDLGHESAGDLAQTTSEQIDVK
jgi:4-amino-4-deoxy-L-arabinose transferase-like glycosyltransferase